MVVLFMNSANKCCISLGTLTINVTLDGARHPQGQVRIISNSLDNEMLRRVS
jgi:hypothetical protein